MRRSFRVATAFLVVALALAACGKGQATATPEPVRGGTPVATASPTPLATASPTPVSKLLGLGLGRSAVASLETDLPERDLPDFAARLERAMNSAMASVVAQAPKERTGDDAQVEFSVTAPTSAATLKAEGLAFPTPWPPRFEAAFTFDKYAAQSGETVSGVAAVNFVYDGRANPPAAYALFRAVIEELGPYKGRYTVHGEIQGGKLTALVTGVGLASRSRNFGGRQPRDFLSYVSTVAGTGKPGFKDGDASEAQFKEPWGVFVDHKGRIWVADTENHAVREITPEGKVSTLSTAFDQPADLGMDGIGLLVVSDRAQGLPDGGGSINQVVTDGILKGTVIRLVGKSGTPPDSPFGYCAITQVSCDGRTPMAGMTWVGGIDVHGGLILAAQWAWESIRAVTPDGMVMTLKSWSMGLGCSDKIFGSAYDVAQGNRGEVYFTSGCNVVNVLEPDGTHRVLAGKLGLDLGFKDGRGAEAEFSYPEGLVFDGDKYLYLTDASNAAIRRVDTETGDVVRVAGCRSNVEGFNCNSSTGLRDGPGDYTLFYGPANLALDRWGDLYVADTKNHAIRLVRMVQDPDRTPSVIRIQPLAVQKGAKATVTVTGRSLSAASSVDLGPGLKVEVKERSYRRLKLAVEVSEDAEAGPRKVSVRTPFGTATTPDGMTLKVMTQKASKAQVKTIAGTGKWSPGLNDLIPAEKAEFAFPGGLAAIDKDRLLVADPLEQRVRLVTTKDGAAQEILELTAYQAGGSLGLVILEGIGVITDLVDDIAGLFGGDTSDAELKAIIGQALDEICKAANSECEYMALPWAGLPMAAGDTGGFRLNARLLLPVDVAVIGDGQFLIADSGNGMIKTVGLDISGAEPKPAPYQVGRTDELRHYPLAVEDTGTDTAAASTAAASTLAKVTLRDGSSVLTDFAGVNKAFRCERADGDVRHPMGLPMGISRGKIGTFIADPYCKTIWRLQDNGEVEDIRGKLKLDVSPLPPCSDGPLVFATWGAPMDVAVDAKGNIWVADAGCHSVRLIKDMFEESGAAGLARDLGSWADGINYFLETETLETFSEWSKDPNLGLLEPAKWWVTTVAGSPDGDPGFKDGPASEARFNAPVAIAVADDDGDTVVFVSDVGNKRIRRITFSSKPETETVTPPPERIDPRLAPPGPPLPPLAAVNHLLALPWYGLSRQYEADAVKEIKDALHNRYIAKGTGTEDNYKWEFSIQVKDLTTDVDLGAPPGFVNASAAGFEMAMPLEGTWRFGFAGRVEGKAKVESGGLTLFTWTPELLEFGLGVSDFRVTSDVDLDSSKPGVPGLKVATVKAQALVKGTGALSFSVPVNFTALTNMGGLALKGRVVDEGVDLGSNTKAGLTADITLTVLPVRSDLDIEIDPLSGVRETVKPVVELPDDTLVDVTIPLQIAHVKIEGELSVNLNDLVRVSVPLTAGFFARIPSSDEFHQALTGLKPPLPKKWGEGEAPKELAINAADIRPPAEMATVAAEVEKSLREFHAPEGVVMSLLRPNELIPPQFRKPPQWEGEADSAIWTGHYLAAAAYRYAAAPSEDALAGVKLALGGMERLFDVTTGAAVSGSTRAVVRQKGLLSRTFIISTAEIDFAPSSDMKGPLNERGCYYEKPEGGWKLNAKSNTAVYPTLADAHMALALQGGGTLKEIEPEGNVSYGWGCGDDHPITRDQYIGAMMGLGVAYHFVQDPDVRTRTALLIEQALDFLIETGWNMPLPPEDRIAGESTFLGNFGKQLALLRLGKSVNPRKYGARYDEVAQASALSWVPVWFSTIDPKEQYFKFNLTHGALVLILVLEQDSALRANYMIEMDMIWDAVGHHRNAYFDLLHVLVRQPGQQQAAALDERSRFDGDITLRQEIVAVLAEWVKRREMVKSPNGLPLYKVPDWETLQKLWPDEVDLYTNIEGGEFVLAVKALPVWLRLGRNMDFMWQRHPFEVGWKDIDRTVPPTEEEIVAKGSPGLSFLEESPGVDYLVAYWLAVYLKVVPQ